MCYPVVANEENRLRAVADLGILDTPREPEFDAIVELAREMLSAPIGLISVLDRDRQWFKAASGLAARETRRDLAFCNHTILGSRPFVVEDALRDPRLSRNALVTGEPFIRSYAGVPLFLAEDLAIGSLCVLDVEPRHFSERDLLRLGRLGDLVACLLRQYRNSERLTLFGAELSARHNALASHASDLEVQKRIFDEASSLAKLGAWTRDLRTGKYQWSDEMYALHEVGQDFEITDESISFFYPQEELRRLAGLVEEAERTGLPYTFEGEMVTAKGNRRHIRLTGRVQVENGVTVRRYGTKQDVTLERTRNEEITRLAERDSLTGLYNRRFFQGYLHGVSGKAGKGDGPVHLLLLDLDGFKDVNDSHGHAAGDHCLRVVGGRLRALPFDNLLVARIGGDEFAVIMRARSLPGLPDRAAERIIDAVLEPIPWMDHALELTTSIGIADGAADGSVDADELLLEADLALYAAKDAGRNRFRRFDDSLRAAAHQRSLVLRNMRAALSAEELELYYQPKVRLSDGLPHGFEALLRWNSPDGRVLAPGAFAEALADPKLGVDIGTFVIRAALDQAKRWTAAGLPFGSIAINLSSVQFRDTSTADLILREIALRRLPPRMIEVEVTEDVFLSRSSQTVLEACRRLKQNGVRIAFDDFGTGFASLTHLMEFPVDIIKIDRSFVSTLAQRADTTAIVDAIVGMSRALGLEVVAEGVETEEQAQFLRAIGCGFAQGYFYGRPVPAPDVVEQLCGRPLNEQAA